MIIKYPTIEIPGAYKSNKKFGRLIRNQIFEINHRDIEAKFKITYVKYDEYTMDVSVNIKIQGIWNRWHWAQNQHKLTSNFSKERARNRNSDIRWASNSTVKQFFSLMGVPQYNVKIGTIKVVDSL